MSLSDEEWMRRALDEAALAAHHRDVPIGCIIIGPDGAELGRAHNRREADADPTAHAEILALRAAAHSIGTWRLEGASAIVTLEPCAMCAGALVNARVGRLIYAAPDPKAGAVDSLFSIGKDARLNHRFEVSSGLCAAQSAELLRAFFAQLRAAGEK